MRATAVSGELEVVTLRTAERNADRVPVPGSVSGTVTLEGPRHGVALAL